MTEMRWLVRNNKKVLQYREVVYAEGSDYVRYGEWKDVPIED